MPTSDSSFEYAHGKIIEDVLTRWRSKHSLEATFYFVPPSNDRMAIIEFPFHNHDSKVTAAKAMRQVAIDGIASSIGFASEAWTVVIPKPTEGTIDPTKLPRASEHPDRVEILQLIHYAPALTRMTTWHILRPPNGPPTLSEPETTENLEEHLSLFSNPFPIPTTTHSAE